MAPSATELRFLNDTKSFLREVPFSPPSVNATRGTGTTTQSFTKVKFLAVEDRIAFIRLKADTEVNKTGAQTFTAKYSNELTLAQQADAVPIWWLPWMPGHMTKLKIEPVGTPVPAAPTLLDSTGQAIVNPRIFVTSALSGCSVFVTRAPDSPAVYHGGLESNLSKFFETRADALTTFAPHGTSNEFWSTILDGVTGHTGAKPARDSLYDGNNQSMAVKQHPVGHVPKTARPTTRGVHKQDYMNFNNTGTTPAAQQYEQFLKDQNKRDFRIEVATPWASVVGIRNVATGLWKFYVQENVTVSYRVYRKKTALGITLGNKSIDITVDELKSVSKVNRLVRFYPGAASIKPGTAPSILVR